MRILYVLCISVFCFFACNGGSDNTTSSTTSNSTEVSNNQAGSDDDAPGKADIEVSVSGMPDGPTFLIGHFGDQQFRVDSTFLKNGSATFNKTGGYLQGFYLIYLPNRTTLQVLLSGDQEFSLTSEVNNLVYGTKVNGSLDNELLYESLQYQNDLAGRFQNINQQLQQASPGTAEYNDLLSKQTALTQERKNHLESLYAKGPNSLFTSFKKAGQNPDLRQIANPDGSVNQAAQVIYYRREFWDNVDFSDVRLMRTPVIANKLKRYIKELTVQHPDSILASTDLLMSKVENKHREYYKFISNWVALQYQPTETTLMDAEAVMVHIVQNYFTDEKAYWAQPGELAGLRQRASEMAASLVNKQGPDVVSTGPDGKTYSIYDMKEPYIVVYMYNPECEHCQEETPVLKQYHDRNRGKVGVFAIAIDTDDTKWKNYIQKVGMQNFVNVFDPTNRSIYAKYFVNKTPEMYVLNKDRIIIGKNLKTFQLDELISRDQAN